MCKKAYILPALLKNPCFSRLSLWLLHTFILFQIHKMYSGMRYLSVAYVFQSVIVVVVVIVCRFMKKKTKKKRCDKTDSDVMA